MTLQRENYRLWRASLLTILACCVFSINFLDPINWPKQIALVTLIPFLVYEALDLSEFNLKQFKLVTWAFFVSVMLFTVTSLVTNENFTRTLWGTWGRNNGYITQVSLFSLAFSFFLLAGIPNFNRIFLKSIPLGMLPASIYGLAQYFGLDWVNWANTDQLFSFFGNTNFAASIFGLIAISSLSLLIIEGFQAKLAPLYVAQVILGLFLSWKTQSIQGVVMMGLVISLFIYTKLISKLRLPRIATLPTLGIGVTLGLLGFLGKGPLSFLYQYTFELRSFYWQVGLRMGLDNPIFGVGIDSYGDFYRQSRSVDVAQATTTDLTVNNAHNSIIQIFATTGIVGSLAVLMWILPALVLAIGLLTSKVNSNEEKVIPIIFLGSFAISMISIDNIAVAILHWAITGVLLRRFFSGSTPELKSVRDKSRVTSGNREAILPILRWILIGSAFIFVWFASSADRGLIQVFNTPADTSDEISITNRISSLRTLSDKENFLQETHYSYMSDGIFKADAWPIAYEVVKLGITDFPRDFNLLDRAAVLAEKLSKFEEAELLRREQLEIDPKHPKVMLYLARNLMEQGKLSEANLTVKKSYEFNSLLDDTGIEYRRLLEDTLKARSK